MGKYIKSNKVYKSTTFVPRKRKIAVLTEINYQELVFKTLKEKYRYFIVGFGVLFGVIGTASHLVLKNTTSNNALAANKKTENVVIVETPTPTLLPTAVVTQPISPTLLPSLPVTVTVKVENKPKEVVETPKVDPQKAAEAAKAQPGAAATTYIVKAGDTLWKIAEKAYKSGFNYKDLVAYNKLKNANSIVVGQEIILPAIRPQLPTDPKVLAQGGVGGPSDEAAISATMTDKITNSASNYTVVKGDTLWSIAARTLGDGFSWVDIAKANGVSDPSKLEVGKNLVIPR